MFLANQNPFESSKIDFEEFLGLYRRYVRHDITDTYRIMGRMRDEFTNVLKDLHKIKMVMGIAKGPDYDDEIFSSETESLEIVGAEERDSVMATYTPDGRSFDSYETDEPKAWGTPEKDDETDDWQVTVNTEALSYDAEFEQLLSTIENTSDEMLNIEVRT